MIEINDNSKGSQVKFALNYSSARKVTIFSIIPHAEVIYFDRTGKNPLPQPPTVKLHFSNDNLKDVCAAFISNVSIYFSEKEVKKSYEIHTKNNYKIEIQKDYSSFDAKILMIISDENRTVISLRMRKNKIYFLLKWMKSVLENGANVPIVFNLNDKGFRYSIAKTKDSLLTIRDSVMLQREMEIARFLVDETIFSYKKETTIESVVGNKHFTYFKNPLDASINLIIRKRNSSKKTTIAFNPECIAALFLATPQISPPQKELPEVLDKATEVTRSNNVYIGFERNPKEHYDFIRKKGGLALHFVSVEKENACDILVDLKSDWSMILSTLFELYNGNENLFDENKRFSYTWMFQNKQKNGVSRYIEWRILATQGSKQIASIMIRTTKFNKGKSDKKENEIILYFTRQLLYGFISTFLGVVEKIEKYRFSFKHHLDKKQKLIVENGENDSSILTDKNGQDLILNNSDKALLKVSAFHYLYYRRWLSFQGEDISISEDGFITTKKREYMLSDVSESNIKGAPLSMYLSYKGVRNG